MTYTREQILAMVPGLELDKLVSVYVMGWEIRKYFDYHSNDGSYHEHYIVKGEKYENANYPDQWQPSKCIESAWKVADKFKIAIIPQALGAPNELKYLARAEWNWKHEAIDVFAETAPEAICKCALLAVLDL